MDAQAERVDEGGELPVRAPPREMERIPWEVAQDAIGVKGAVFIALIVRMLLKARQDALRVHVAETTGDSERMTTAAAQDAIGPPGPEP